MAWIRRADRMFAGTSTVSAVQAQMVIVGEIFADATSDWSYNTYIYDTNYVALMLTHTTDAQIILAWGAGSSGISASNLYGGTGAAAYYTFVAYKPSNGLSFATITSSVNPYDTATYCADAGAYKFIRAYFTSGSGDNIALYNSYFQVIVDDTYSNVVMFMTEPSLGDKAPSGHIVVCYDDGISELEEVGDTYTSIFGAMQSDQALSSQIVAFATVWGLKIQFKDSGGSVIEGAYLRGRQGDLAATTQRDGLNQGYDRDRVAVGADTGSYARGRKGFMNTEMLSVIRSDARRNVRLTCSSNQYLHLNSGIVIPWGSIPPLQ